MFALNSRYYIHKCSSCRYVSGIVAMMDTMRVVETRHRHQNVQQSPEMPIKPHGAANFHTSATRCRNLLTKMLVKKKKKRWFENPQPLFAAQSGFLAPAKKKKQEDSQRVRTLNIVVYKAVTDLLASHEVGPDLTSHGVEITKVSFTADFSSCRIYWKTSWSDDRDGQIQPVLDKSAPRIRYLLMSLQILSNVPPLVFVRDKKYAALKEVEDLLDGADYGPSEDSGSLFLDGKDKTRLRPAEPLDKKRPLWFAVDHDALHKQIEDYKQRSRDTHVAGGGGGSPGLTLAQLEVLAEIRKQKLIEKKRRKSKKQKDDDDDDVTPKAFLLARQLQEEEREEELGREHSSEDGQVSELMADYSRKH